MPRIFVDTNVLFPFAIMDLLLALSEDGVHEVIWSESLLQEWERVIVREQRRSPASAASITAAIREFFDDSEVPESEYTPLVEEMPGQDPDDRHHMAAAITGRARTLITWNTADFPAAPLAQHGLRITDPETYLCELLDEIPDEIVATVVRLAAEKSRPSRTPTDLTATFAKAGVPQFAERLRSRVDLSGERP